MLMFFTGARCQCLSLRIHTSVGVGSQEVFKPNKHLEPWKLLNHLVNFI